MFSQQTPDLKREIKWKCFTHYSLKSSSCNISQQASACLCRWWWQEVTYHMHKHISNTISFYVWKLRQNRTSRHRNLSDHCSCWHRVAFPDHPLVVTFVYSVSRKHRRLTHRCKNSNGLKEVLLSRRSWNVLTSFNSISIRVQDEIAYMRMWCLWFGLVLWH